MPTLRNLSQQPSANRLLPSRSMRFPYALIILCAAGAAALVFPQSHLRAGDLEMVLKSGARIQADVLKRTEEKVFVDLGYLVLTVPVEEIATENTLAETKTSESETAEETENPQAATNGPKRKPRRRTGTFKDMVRDLEEAVVVVSNPHGYGAGFIIDPTGLVMTNYHVIRGEKYNDITFFMNVENGKKKKKVFRKVEVMGFSSYMDCAILKISDEDLEGITLPVLDIADPESIKTGGSVYAIGNPGLGSKMLKHSVTEGILSSTTRNFNDILYLQTTAAINPGNSGGPLLDTRGDVVGLVTFRAIWGEGLGFALPAWYLRHFSRHVGAFAPAEDTKNTGYRYHDPSK